MTGMAGLLLLLLLSVNLGISWWNARVVGLDWVESKFIGGYVRFMCWMGWLMSALGFTWCYVLMLSLLAHGSGYIDARERCRPPSRLAMSSSSRASWCRGCSFG